MANSIPVGHYSQSGEQTINRMSKDDIEYTKFLKYFGRVFKHPVSVALEFYVNRPDAQFIASGKSVLNKNKTQVAQSKAKAIKEKFSEWIFATEERKEKYVRRYNEKFNNLVGRSYDGSHLTFSGMADGFKLRPHQLDCVARTIYGGNTLAAHCVGAGKSAVIAASVMKKKELGLIRFYTVTFKKGLLPCRKKFKQQPFSWTNDAELDKLLILNKKINQGATIQSMKQDFENLEQKLKEKNESAVEVQKKVQRLSRGQEAFEVLYEGKKSETISLEEAQLYQKRYPNINANTYHQTKELADTARQEQAVLKNEINELEKEIRELSSAISVAEQVRAGTYVQELVSSENIHRNADVLPNGVFKI